MQAVDSSEKTGPPALEIDENRLWPRAAAGDVEAAEELAQCTYRTIYASLFRLCGGDEDLAADLTQETYRKAWKAIKRFRGGSRFSTWLYRIAYNTFLNHIRGPRRLETLDEEQAEQLSDPAEDPHESLDRSHQGERLRKAVLELPDELRFAVTARFWAELPLREIARLQGITKVGVHKRLKRAYTHLAGVLDEVAS